MGRRHRVCVRQLAKSRNSAYLNVRLTTVIPSYCRAINSQNAAGHIDLTWTERSLDRKPRKLFGLT